MNGRRKTLRYRFCCCLHHQASGVWCHAKPGAAGDWSTVMTLEIGKRYPVFAIRKTPKEMHIWTRAGNAFVNKDGSLNLVLDVLPLDGRLHVREAADQRDSAGSTQKHATVEAPAEAVGGH